MPEDTSTPDVAPRSFAGLHGPLEDEAVSAQEAMAEASSGSIVISDDVPEQHLDEKWNPLSMRYESKAKREQLARDQGEAR